jgi:integrase
MTQPLTMVRHARTYLQYRRSLGFALRGHGRLVMHFARFLDRGHRDRPLTIDLMLRWVNANAAHSPSYRASRLTAVRCFTRYLATHDDRIPVPPARLLSVRIRRCRPHIYNPVQLEQLLSAAGRLDPHFVLRPLTFQTLLGLIAATGLRVSEVIRLHRTEVDLERGLLQITQTKFKKSRLVPMHPTTTLALRHYRNMRDKRWGVQPERPFFLDATGRPLPARSIQCVFRKLCEGLGWQRGNGELPKPRIHDLRHSFACRRLLLWHRDGQDIGHRIAALTTYLGHGKVRDTYWYLTGTPELLAIAGDRFAQFAGLAEGSTS